MPKLSQKEFAELVRSMPGASEQEILAEAKRREGFSDLERTVVGLPPAEPERSLLGKVWDFVRTPLTDMPSRAASAAAQQIDRPQLDGDAPAPGLLGAVGVNNAQLRGFTAGATEGVGNVLSQLTSPLDLALTLTGFGGAAAAKRGLTGASQGLRAAEKALMAPVVAEGGYNVGTGIIEGDAAKAGMGALQGALGLAGMRNPTPRGSVGRAVPEAPAAAPRPQGPTVGASPDVPAVQRMAGDVPPEFHAVLDAFDDPKRFVDPTQSPLLTDDYGILTWANPGKTLSPAENAQRVAALEKALRGEGFNPRRQKGVFDAEEESFLVPGMKAEDAKRFGRMGEQVSVISREGYHRLADDATFPNRGVQFDQSADNYYSVVDLPGHGPVKYQMNFPDEAFGPPATSGTPTAPAAALPDSAVASGGTGQPSQPSPKGSTTALAVAAPAAAMAIPDDPDSKWDDYGRLGLTLAGAAGLGAAVRGRQVKELTPLQDAIHKGAAALWTGGKKAWQSAVGPSASPQLYEASKKVLDRHLEKTAQQLTNTKKLLALHKKGAADLGWYDKTGDELRQMFGKDAEIVVRFLAATSNNATIPSNATMALKALRQYKMGEPFDGFLPVVKENLSRVVRGESIGELNGRKVDNFVKALMGDPDAVVVDRWIMRAFGFNRGTAPTDLQYDFMENTIRQLAQAQGVAPRQMQAAIWFAVKNTAEKGKKRPPSPPYEIALKDSINRQHEKALRENKRFDTEKGRPNLPF